MGKRIAESRAGEEVKNNKMVILSLLPLLLALLCGVSICTAGQPAPAKLSVEEVIGKAWKAMFGERQDGEIRSVYLEGYFHGGTVPNRMTIRRPNRFRSETRSGILVFDGQRAAWAKREPDEKGNPQGPELIEPKYWRHFEVDIAIVFPAFFDHRAELQGIEKINGVDAYKLYVQLPLGSDVTYFVDSTTFLVTKRLVSWDGDPAAQPWENLIEDYVNVDGIVFPDGYVFTGRDGQEKGFYKNVRFNVDAGDELFKIPEELD